MLNFRLASVFTLLVSLAAISSAQTVQINRGTAEILGTERADNVTVTTQRSSALIRYDDTLVISYKIYSRTYSKKFALYDKFGRRLISRIRFKGGNGNDTFRNRTMLPSTAYGGNNDDVLIGGSQSDTFYGDAGNDHLVGNGGNDNLYGGLNNDFMDGGPGRDVLLGDDVDSAVSQERRDYDEFKDEFNLSTPALGGTGHLDVDQERSQSCTILSSISSAAFHGVQLSDRIYQSRRDAEQFAIMLYTGENKGTGTTTVPVKFDGTWSSNDAPPVRERVNGRPVGPMTGEFWPTLFQRAYLNKYVSNWKDHPVEISNWLRDGDPESKRGSWGRRGHALRAIVGGTNAGSFNWNSYTVNGTPNQPEAIDVWFLLEQGHVLTTAFNGHVVALLDVWQENKQWMITIYNQRACDAYANQGVMFDGVDDGVMTLTFSDFSANWGVITPFSAAPASLARNWRLMLYFSRF